MFKKMKNRNGFTLIEMLVVIAIIAILVAVMVPIVTGSTDKASAATNASNLRGVEGEIVTMMLLDATLFPDNSERQEEIDNEQAWREEGGAALNQAQAALTNAQNALDNYDPTTSTAYITLQSAKTAAQNKANEQADWQAKVNSATNTNHSGCVKNSFPVSIVFPYASHASDCKTTYENELNEAKLATVAANAVIPELEEAYNEAAAATKAGLEAAVETAKGVVEEVKKGNTEALDRLEKEEIAMYELTAIDGIITLTDGTQIKAPASKAVSTDTVNIDKDIQMVVYVNPSNYTAYAYYNGDAQYSAKDFAVAAGNDEGVTG